MRYRDIAELFLRGRITEQEALELKNSRRQLDKEIERSCVRQGIATQTMRHEYGNVPKRHHSKYRA